MVAGGTLATFLVAGAASLFMAWAIGAGSSGSTPFAPAVGANAISVMRAGFFVGLLGLAGAVLQGANVTEAVGRELILNVTLSPTAAVVALKICLMPALVWAVFSALAVDPATFTASVVMLGTPTAVSTFVFANELGGDREFASLNVFVTTLASVATLFVLITLVS